MTVLGVTRPLPDVLVATSRLWQANATAVRVGGTVVLVDSVVLPEELARLPAVLAQAGFEPGLLVDADEELLVVRPSPAPRLDDAIALPRRGQVRLGDAVLDVLPADGHSADAIALFAADPGVLLAGDYLSPVEVPLVSRAGNPRAYARTLERLEPYVRRAGAVVPGHGEPMDPERALAVLRADLEYVRALCENPDGARPPRAPLTLRQQRIHEDNVAKHAPRRRRGEPDELASTGG